MVPACSQLPAGPGSYTSKLQTEMLSNTEVKEIKISEASLPGSILAFLCVLASFPALNSGPPKASQDRSILASRAFGARLKPPAGEIFRFPGARERHTQG